MSYELRVLNDSPLGFWELNAFSPATYGDNVISYNDSNINYNSELEEYISDTTTYQNSAAQFGGSEISLYDVLPLVTNSNYDGTLHGAKFKSTSKITISNVSNKYKMFYTGTESLSFGIEFWLSFDQNPAVTNNIMTIKNGSDTIGIIYANNDKIYFTIYGKDKSTSSTLFYTAFKQVKSWDSQNHILASYSNGHIKISVNAMGGDTTTVSDSFIFNTAYNSASNIKYELGPAPTENNFVLNDLAFYDYVLSDNLIKSHMVWGTTDSSPQNYIKQTAGYFFDIKETDDMFAFKRDFSDPKNYNEGIINNLIIDRDGLTLKNIPSLIQEGTSGTLNVSSGSLSVTGSLSAKFKNFSNYFKPNSFSIVGKINWVPNTGSSPAVIFSMDGINGDEWLYLAQSTDKKLTLYHHKASNQYPYGYTEKIIAQISTAINSTATYDFGLAVDNNNVILYASGVGTAQSTTMPSYSYKNINLYFGNEYSSATTLPLSGSINNISILSRYQNPSSYLLYGQKDAVTITFNNTLNISQKGTWTYSVASSLLKKVVGSRISWDSATSDNSVVSINQNVVAEISIDNGSTWNKITNGYPATHFSDSSLVSYPNTMFRFNIFSNDSSSLYLPRIDNALIVMYKNLGIISDGGAFQILPRPGSYTGDTYSIKKNFFNVLARSTNFGIKFNNVSNKNSVAIISPKVKTDGIQTVEFWFRYDELSSSSVQVILDTKGTLGNLYFDTLGFLRQSGFGAVYVNGIYYNGTKNLVKGESYHIACVYNFPTNSDIYLGGDVGLNNYSLGTYGFISLYPSILSQTDIQNRYLSYLSSSVAQINYTTSISGASNIIGTIAELSGGSTVYNAGNAILSYTRPTNVTL